MERTQLPTRPGHQKRARPINCAKRVLPAFTKASLEDFQRVRPIQIVDTHFRPETRAIRGFQSLGHSVNRTAVLWDYGPSLGRAKLSDLVVFDFDGIHTADEVLNKLRSLEKEYLIDLEDACVVEREKDGKVHIKQAVNLTAMGAAQGGMSGALWGALVGFLFLNPLAGIAIGGLVGAGGGSAVRLPCRLWHQ
jgi:hypothetical protein